MLQTIFSKIRCMRPNKEYLAFSAVYVRSREVALNGFWCWWEGCVADTSVNVGLCDVVPAPEVA
jgi:hypothetical protein